MFIPTVRNRESVRYYGKYKISYNDKISVQRYVQGSILCNCPIYLPDFFRETVLCAVFDANDLNAKLTEQNLRSRNILSIWSINLKPCSSLLPKIYNRHEGNRRAIFDRFSCCLHMQEVQRILYIQKFYVLKVTSRS